MALKPNNGGSDGVQRVKPPLAPRPDMTGPQKSEYSMVGPGLSVMRSDQWPAKETGLSPREAEVIGLIVQGLSNKDIAAQCYLSTNSVKTFIRSAYRKMGVSTRAQAVAWGIDHGLKPDRRGP
ncbi:response regulator transcription factor [Dietzia cinnamea]|uniref:response regulator transcription factor n=1 Tax=Dietzia cinnamea TaxID=321318 RepID=UPI00288324A2|nr:helix-turn-helix transcriptional regulator [Dietzia cinnamea]